VLMRGNRIPGPIQAATGLQLVSAGEQAASVVTSLLCSARTVLVRTSGGMAELRPGAIWDGDKMLVYASPSNVGYSVGDKLYEGPAADFIRDEWSFALKPASARTKPILYLAQDEIAALRLLLVSWYQILRAGSARIGAFYYRNRSLFEAVFRDSPVAVRHLLDTQHHLPVFYDILTRSKAQKTLAQLPRYFTSQDIGYFAGIVIQGDPPETTLGVIPHIILVVFEILQLLAEELKKALIIAIVVESVRAVFNFFTLIFGPLAPFLQKGFDFLIDGIKFESLKQKALERAGSRVQQRLNAMGVSLSQAEGTVMIVEVVEKTGAEAKLKDLLASLKQLVPLLDRMQLNFQAET
jgi:hypothetical protein